MRNNRDRVYAMWNAGNLQFRLRLTVEGQRPVLDLRLGLDSDAGWIPGLRGVWIELHQIAPLLAALRKASTDINQLGLIDTDSEPMRVRPKPRRWRRD